MLLAGEAVLVGQPGAEQQRVVGPERDPGPGRVQGAQRDAGLVGVDPERDVAAGADLQGDAALHDGVEHAAILDRADPVTDPVGGQVLQGGADVVRAEQLAAVRHRRQPGRPRDPERPGEVGRAAPPLVVAEAEAHHAARPAAGVAHGQPGQGAGIEWMPHPTGSDHQHDGHTRCRRGVPGGVLDDLEGRGQTAQMHGVRRGVDLELEPPGAVAGVVLGGLVHQPSDVGLVAHAGPGDVVEPLEAEPALLVGGPQLGWCAGGQDVGQPDPVLAGQVQQRHRPHRTGEVQVQVGLGQPGDVAAAQACRSRTQRNVRMARNRPRTSQATITTAPGRAATSRRARRAPWPAAGRPSASPGPST